MVIFHYIICSFQCSISVVLLSCPPIWSYGCWIQLLVNVFGVPFGQVFCQVHFTRWSGLPKWASSWWQGKTFLGCPMPKFFPVCQNFYPKNLSCHLHIYIYIYIYIYIFIYLFKILHQLLLFAATPPLLLQVLSFFFALLFLWVIWCLFEGSEQPFQNWNHSLNLLNLVNFFHLFTYVVQICHTFKY